MNVKEKLQTLLCNRHLPGHARGIYSVCTANPTAIRAAMRQARADDSPLLLEATSNQVNQFGGYTRMRPADFRELAQQLAAEESLPFDRIILGGDHLGPNPWQHEPAKIAMAHAEELVAEYAREGFVKLHLDASMPCADDPSPLLPQTVALRSARLCAAAERAVTGTKPVYVIGTEVPTPGGATEGLDSLAVTTVAAAEKTLEEHRRQFAGLGLTEAFERVIAVVVQPGVEFNHDSVHEYDGSQAQALSSWLRSRAPLVFEAHSSDYQREQAYFELLRDGFAILKVGPAVTFAMREAIFALAAIEAYLLPETMQSCVRETVERVMLASPANWKSHYHGNAEEQGLLRTFSYSDRIRYYWSHPEVHAAVERLMENLRSVSIPETMLSAFLPLEYAALRDHQLSMDPMEILLHATQRSLQPYAQACFPRH
jgi:D-tagatose-1,6-bisphosphate aldolase subunit GatZ/KbaZ